MGLKRAVESKTSFKKQKIKTMFYYIEIWRTFFIFTDMTETKVIFYILVQRRFDSSAWELLKNVFIKTFIKISTVMVHRRSVNVQYILH